MSWPAHLRVVPVVTLPDVGTAVPLTRALAVGGLPVVEVTLRSPAALDGVRRIRAELPDVLCGVGTVTTPADVDAAVAAGAQFLVSPGTTAALLDAMLACGLPVLPGAATASEALRLIEAGLSTAKFFPAEASGGTATLEALAAPLPGLRWCATGGIGPGNAADYLALPCVAAVGGSWMAPDADVRAGRWDQIEALSAAAVELATPGAR